MNTTRSSFSAYRLRAHRQSYYTKGSENFRPGFRPTWSKGYQLGDTHFKDDPQKYAGLYALYPHQRQTLATGVIIKAFGL